MTNLTSYTRMKVGLYGLIFVVLFASGVTLASYTLLSNIAYNPKQPTGGAEVFLAPRYYGGQNDLPSGVFDSWTQLLIFGSLSFLILTFGFFLSRRKNLPFVRFLIIIYLLALGMEACFLTLTANGFEQLALQSRSINNGTWSSIQWLSSNPNFAGHSNLEKLQYIFVVLGGNNAGYTIPGTTHPPGSFLLGIELYHLAQLLPFPVAYGWGIIVSLLNTMLVIVVGLLSRDIFSDSIARRTCLMLIVVPSAVMHFCAVGAGIPALLVALGALVMVNALKYLRRLPAGNADITSLFLYGLAAGTAFTLAAQVDYGIAFPILALIISFSLLIHSISWRDKAVFFSGLLLAPVLYFIFEYYVSGGQLFYPIRALRITKSVGEGLASSRPYPLTQFANFVVMSVMGGLLFLPTLYFVLNDLVKRVRCAFIHLVLPSHSDRDSVRTFIVLATTLMFAFLVTQSTVFLEVERTWFWFFPFVWSLMGIFLLALRVTARRLFPQSSFARNWTDWVFYASQLGVSIVLAMVIMDYY